MTIELASAGFLSRDAGSNGILNLGDGPVNPPKKQNGGPQASAK
jgi:hypothetical protein